MDMVRASSGCALVTGAMVGFGVAAGLAAWVLGRGDRIVSSPLALAAVGLGAVGGALFLRALVRRELAARAERPATDGAEPEVLAAAAVTDPFESTTDLLESASPAAREAMRCVELFATDELGEGRVESVFDLLSPEERAEVSGYVEAVAAVATEHERFETAARVRKCGQWLARGLGLI
jgi:hypothetical protein